MRVYFVGSLLLASAGSVRGGILYGVEGALYPRNSNGTSPATSTTASTLSSTSSSATASPSASYSGVSGCFVDTVNPRIFAGPSTTSSAMTNALCAAFCNNQGYAYSGTEYSRECYCSNTPAKQTATTCTYACAGANQQMCGGSGSMNVTYNSTAAATYAANQAKSLNIVYKGCYVDNYPTSRILNGTNYAASGSMTVESCARFCIATNYALAGLENGDECYCGNAVSTDGSSYGILSPDACTYTCSGNSTENCGASNHVNVWAAAFATSSSSMSSSSTTSVSASSSSRVSSTTTISPSTTTTTTPPTTTMATTAITSSSSITSTYTTTTSFVNPLPSGITNGECISDYLPGSPNGVRTLSGPSMIDYSITLSRCNDFCSGYSFYGVEYSHECYCGNAIANSAGPANNCTTTCAGDATESCGGNWAMNIWVVGGIPSSHTSSSSSTTSTASSTSTPTPSNLATVGSYKYAGCYTDSTSNRTLTSASYANYNTMTVESCSSFCSGYTYFGVEWYGECYCGNGLVSSSMVAAAGDCNTACAGNAAELCGGANRLSLYTLGS